MKPKNWDKLPAEEQREIATELFGSTRGQLIMGQALGLASALLRTVEYPETSNIQDMEMLGEALFAWSFAIYASPPQSTKEATNAV